MVKVNTEELQARWPVASGFYSERDNRTSIEVADLERYATRPVEILIDPHQGHNPTVQQIALLACNLTARWARRVRVIVPEARLDQQLVRDGSNFLGDRILTEMRAADPFGDFQVTSPECKRRDLSPELPLRLFVGPWRDPAKDGQMISPDDYLVHAYSWTAVGQRGAKFKLDVTHKATPAAAGLAASVGVADLFKRAIGHPRKYWIPNLAWCTWSHTLTNSISEQHVGSLLPVSQMLDFGRTLIAGVGAIGSALIYLADFISLRGHLTLLDRDHVELSNLNRSPLFQVAHVLADAEKTVAAQSYLSAQEIDLQTLTGTWREHATELASAHYDVWISLTNEDGAWAEVPFQLPPIVLHGTTTSGWGISAGRHIPRREDCTLCRMPRPAAEFRGPCAEGEIELITANAPVRASLPFLSTASAALVLAEMLKLGTASLATLPNDISADFRFGLPAVISLMRLNNSACRGCRASLSSLWNTRGGRGRYRAYSEAA